MKRTVSLALTLLGVVGLIPIALADDPVVTRLSPEAIFAARSLRSWDSQIVGVEGEWNPREPKVLLAQMYDTTIFRLIRGDTSVRSGSAYTDAKNTNNTVTLSGDELVRLLGL